MGVDAEAAAVVQSHTVLHLTSSGTDVTAPVSRPGTQLTAKIGEREKKLVNKQKVRKTKQTRNQ